MRIDQLRSFVVLSDERNFTKAAERLYMTQPNLTKHMKALEGELGCKLVTRDPRSVGLTAAGAAFLPFARKTVRAMDDGVAAMREAQRHEGQSLRIGGSFLSYNMIAPQLAADFAETRPEFRIEFSEVRMERAIVDIRKGELAGAFLGSVDLNDFSEPLRHIPIEVMGEKALVGCSHPWASREWISKDDLEGSTLLYAGRLPSPRISPVMKDLEDFGISASINLVDLEGSMFRMVELGQGAACVPNHWTAEGYSVIEVPYISDKRINCSFVWNSQHMSHPLKEFIDYLHAKNLNEKNPAQ